MIDIRVRVQSLCGGTVTNEMPVGGGCGGLGAKPCSMRKS